MSEEIKENKEQSITVNQLKKIERDENGLIKGLEYKFLSDGFVDWKAMIPPQFLYVNSDPKRRERLEKKYGKSYEELDPIKDNIADSDLICMLGGLKHLLKLRGFNDVNYWIKESNMEYASVNCSIQFIGNYETEMKDISYSDNACAHLNNTTSFAKHYLIEMATNRALCRTIRSFLNINIVSKEEIQEGLVEESKPPTPNKQVKLLDDLMLKKRIKWEHVVDKLKKENKWKEEYTGTKDLEKDVIFDLIERLRKIELPK